MLKTKLHVPATSCCNKGSQISTSVKRRFVVLSPSHEKFTNTHPSGGGDGVGVADGDVSACSVDADTGADGADTGSDGVDTGADGVDTGSDGVDTGTDGVDTGTDGAGIGSDCVDADADGVGTGTDSVELTCYMTR